MGKYALGTFREQGFGSLGSILIPAIARDTLGHIFSGSAIVDKHNSAGYGENTIVAFLYFAP